MAYQLFTLGLMAFVALGTMLYYCIRKEGSRGIYGRRQNGRCNLQNPRARRRIVYQQRPDFWNECCAICQASLKENNVRRVSCGHIYHDYCIDKWMITGSTCPLCRAGTT